MKRRLSVQTAFFALALSALLQGSRSADITIESLRKEMAARDARYQTLRVRATFNDRTRKGWARGAPFIDQVQVIDATINTSDGLIAELRAKLDIVQTPDPEIVPRLREGEKKWISYHCAFDGTTSHTLETATNGTSHIGYVSSGYAPPWAVHPSELLSLNYWSPTRLLNSPDLVLAVNSDKTLNGRDLVREVVPFPVEMRGGFSGTIVTLRPGSCQWGLLEQVLPEP